MKIHQLVKTTLFILTIVTCISCKKSNINEHPEFIGNWATIPIGTYYEIRVGSSGKTTYEETTSSKKTTYSGKLIIEGTEMKIGIKKLRVNIVPRQSSDDDWQMTVDNRLYTRY